MLDFRIIACSIARPAAAVYAFLSQPRNFALWAAGLGKGLRQEGAHWVAETPEGLARISFAPPNDFGVADHWVTLPSGAEISVPMRVIGNGEGSLVLFTVFRQAWMDEAALVADAAAVERDLDALKALLEAG